MQNIYEQFLKISMAMDKNIACSMNTENVTFQDSQFKCMPTQLLPVQAVLRENAHVCPGVIFQDSL